MATNNSTNTSLSSQTGTGKFVGDTSPTFVTPILGTPQSGTLTSCTGLPLTTGVTGVLPSANGGTGVNNGSSTITLGGSLTTSGAFASTFTMTNTTGVTFPTSGTLATTSQLPTPAALTRVDDTNVTLTLGGTPATALLQAVSLTLGWSGTLAVSRGGTGLSAAGPAFSAYASSSQNITANTSTLVTLGTELFDTNNNFASSRFTPTVAGYYQINGIVRGTGTTMTLLQALIYKNGSAYNNVQINTNTPSYNTQACISEVIYLNGTTDYVELYGAVYCASGASFDFVDSAITSHFNGCYLRGN